MGDVLEYEDKQVVTNTTYHYHVAAVNSAGEGPQAGHVSATVPPDGGGGGGNGDGGNGGDGDDGGDDSGGFAAWEYLAATVMLVAAVSVGVLVGTRLKRR